MPISIILADDHPIFRDGLVKTLEESGDFEILGVGASADDAFALADLHRPDVALLDLSMPGNGKTAAKRILALEDAPIVAMLTVSEDADDVADALAAGAKGYILKGISARELRKALTDLAAGQGFITPSLATRMLTAPREPASGGPAERLADLTKREEDILKRVARGLSNKETAAELGLQEKTVKHYMTTILGKLHARNRVEAALMAAGAWEAPEQD